MAERRAGGLREPRLGDERRGRIGALAARMVRAARSVAARSLNVGTALAYRRGELVAVALLAGSLAGGAAVEGWRDHHPDAAARLEAEPPRLAPVARGRPADRAAGGDAPRAQPARPSRARSETGRAARVATERPCPPSGRGRARASVPEPDRASAAAAPSADQPLDLNHATPAELIRLPGIGPRLAERIVRHRATVGGYRSTDDLGGVPGLGVRRAVALRPLLTITRPRGDGEPGSTLLFSHPTEDERWERPLRGDSRRPRAATPDHPSGWPSGAPS